MKLNKEILFKVLCLLAEGYDMEFHEDRYILVENPDAKPWDNPNYVIDLKEARELLFGDEAPLPSY